MRLWRWYAGGLIAIGALVWWMSRSSPEAIQQHERLVASRPAFDSTIHEITASAEQKESDARWGAKTAKALKARAETLIVHDTLPCDCVPRQAYVLLDSAYQALQQASSSALSASAERQVATITTLARLDTVEANAASLAKLVTPPRGLLNQLKSRLGVSVGLDVPTGRPTLQVGIRVWP